MNFNSKQQADVADVSDEGHHISDIIPSVLENNSRVLLSTGRKPKATLYITQGKPSQENFKIAQDIIEKLGVAMDTVVWITNWTTPIQKWDIKHEIDVEATAGDVLLARSMQKLRRMSLSKSD